MNIKNREMGFNISPITAIMLFVCLFVVCFIGGTLLNALIAKVLGPERATASLRIAAMVQDVVVFIVPALATAVIANRRPAALLGLLTFPRLDVLLLAAVALLLSLPLLEWVIWWNANLDLSFMGSTMEDLARQMEEATAATLQTMMGNPSWGSLILNILIVGVGAGVSEELLFRGCLVRLSVASGLNRHAAVWGIAILFSALHMQFYGFVPRMLLGAFFGYLFIWSGSVWLPALVHTLNNTMYVAVGWYQQRMGGPVAAEGAEMPDWSFLTCCGCALVAFMALFLIYRNGRIKE